MYQVSRNKGEDNEAKDGEVVPEDIGNFYEQLDKDLDEKEDRKKNTNVWQFEIEQDKVSGSASKVGRKVCGSNLWSCLD